MKIIPSFEPFVQIWTPELQLWLWLKRWLHRQLLPVLPSALQIILRVDKWQNTVFFYRYMIRRDARHQQIVNKTSRQVSPKVSAPNISGIILHCEAESQSSHFIPLLLSSNSRLVLICGLKSETVFWTSLTCYGVLRADEQTVCLCVFRICVCRTPSKRHVTTDVKGRPVKDVLIAAGNHSLRYA